MVTNVIRTVRQFENAGAAGIFIEDQVSPKRCGHMSGKQVIPAEEMVAKLKAALDTRRDPDFVIMARTDALAVHGMDEAISRGNFYGETGADLIFIEAPESVAQMKRINSEVNGPTLANMVPGGKTPILTTKEFQEIGYAVVIYSTANTYIIAKAVKEFFEALHRNGTSAGFDDRMIAFEEFNRLVGLTEIRQTEQKYYHHLAGSERKWSTFFLVHVAVPCPTCWMPS